MDPQGVDVVGFKQPTPEERDHDFLWRIHPHAPGLGRVAIFNRSHYEDVLVARVHNLVPKEVWKPRFDFINDWEKLLATEKNTTILKFFLFISKEEQLPRFKERLDDPARQWKISEGDYSERKLWDDYIQAFETALSRCSTDYAPWFVIPSNHKWFRNFALSQIVADALEHMKLEMPKPTVDLKESIKLPDVSWSETLALLPVAACFVMIVAQSAATSRVYAVRHRERVDEDADILGLAAANAAAAVSGTFVGQRQPDADRYGR
jgi:PPK2 family polyphosphate:nucleotide phosphotransferase